MSYMCDKPPTEDKLLQRGTKPWDPKEHRPVLTASRSAYNDLHDDMSDLHARTASSRSTSISTGEMVGRRVAMRLLEPVAMCVSS